MDCIKSKYLNIIINRGLIIIEQTLTLISQKLDNAALS